MLLYIIYVLSSIFLAGYLFIKIRYSYWTRRGVASIEPKFPYGNLSRNFGVRESMAEYFARQYYKFKGKGPFGGLFMFIQPIIVPIEPNFIKNILVKDFNYFSDRGVYYNEKDDPLSAHLFNVDTEQWRNLRTKLTPTFSSGKMKFMFPTIIGVAKEFESYLQLQIDRNQKEIEIKEILARFTTDVIGTCAFGLECNSLKDPNAEFRKLGKKLMEQPKNSRIRSIFQLNFRGIARKLGLKSLDNQTTEFFMGAVKETIKYREENNIHRKDFMDLLIQLKNNGKLDDDNSMVKDTYNMLTVQQIAAQCFVFFIAGFDTSSSAMSFSLYELALNQEIQDKAREEIKTIYNKYNKSWTYESIMELKYLDQIINESLRKYPPVPILNRRVTKDYKVPDTNITLKAGTAIFIPIYGIHRDPEYFPNPEKYDPDRFTEEEIKKRDPFVYLPFGTGPRNCIGLRFGQMQARIGLAMALLNFKFTTCARTIKPLVMKPNSFLFATIGGIHLNIEQV